MKISTTRVIIPSLALCMMTFSGCTGQDDTKKHDQEQKQKDTKKQEVDMTITLEEGLKYEILQEGDANKGVAKNNTEVVVHYTGYLQNSDGTPGKKFDSSVDSGKAFSFNLGAGHVIRGWDKGVLAMNVGEKRRLTIAPEFGYGKAGHPPVIPQNATLSFDVELLSA